MAACDVWYDLRSSNQRYQLNPTRKLIKAGRQILSPRADGNGGYVYDLTFDVIGHRSVSFDQLVTELFPNGVPQQSEPLVATELITPAEFMQDIENDIKAASITPETHDAPADRPVDTGTTDTIGSVDGSTEVQTSSRTGESTSNVLAGVETEPVGQIVESNSVEIPSGGIQSVTETHDDGESSNTLPEPAESVGEPTDATSTTDSVPETTDVRVEGSQSDDTSGSEFVESGDKENQTVTEPTHAEPTPETVLEPAQSIEPVESVSESTTSSDQPVSGQPTVSDVVGDIPAVSSTDVSGSNTGVDGTSGTGDVLGSGDESASPETSTTESATTPNGELVVPDATESLQSDVSAPDDTSIVPTTENVSESTPDASNVENQTPEPVAPPIDGLEVTPEPPKPRKLTTAESAKLVQDRLATGATVEQLAVKFNVTVDVINKLAGMKL